MPDLLAWIIVAALLIGLFVGLYVLTVKRQADDPKKRGADSSEPPGGIG
jgi:hypothetical protein